MRIRIDSLALVGAERNFLLNPGLNIITGPIASGKTTLLQCLRGLLGDRIEHFPREARETITNLAGELLIGDQRFDVVRPFVTTDTAKVDIAGETEVKRLPVLRATESETTTYGNWLLEKLRLPRIYVPTAPTQPDSATSPLSINDYLMYCYLKQDEIDNSVFGHTHQAKNIKRRFVFEVVYGKYDVEVSSLQEEMRDVYSELRRLKSQSRTIEEFMTGTALENRAALERGVRDAEEQLNALTRRIHTVADDVSTESETLGLKREIFGLEQAIDDAHRRLELEKLGAEQKTRLMAQLQTQSIRLTRSVVAGDYLLDYDFITCPRCGSAVTAERGDPETCYLCLQRPSPQISRSDLIDEQDRIEKQISETRELVALHEKSIASIERELTSLAARRQELSGEIEHRTRSYVSDRVQSIAEAEGERSALQEQIKRLNDYLELYRRQDSAASRIAHLESRYADLEASVEAALSNDADFNERVHFLEETFRQILEQIRVPRYANPGPTVIDRRTYLPIFDGRRFDELQSQGLQVMVNVAHAVAHQLTALHFGLALPNILLIDGLTGNIGYEGLDLERVEAIYSLLSAVTADPTNNFQVIVADNSVPSEAKQFLLIEFTDEDKLIPQHLLLKGNIQEDSNE
jgi:energy-coupling factor transporter ATP-binding protein EcfA2